MTTTERTEILLQKAENGIKEYRKNGQFYWLKYAKDSLEAINQ